MVTEKAVGPQGDAAFTDDEAALYDRQIRLWGAEAQKRLNNAKVLIIGLGGLGAELAKNIILGGVKSVVLMDHTNITENDASCQFLVPRDSVGKNRAEESVPRARLLNPMVEVSHDKCQPEDKPDEFYEQFHVICATACKRSQLVRLNRIARQNGIKFFAADVFGMFGYIFSDLGEHHYKQEITSMGKTDASELTKVIEGTLKFIPFQDFINIDWTMEEFHPRVSKTNPAVFALLVLLEFVEKNATKPTPQARNTELEQILNLRNEYVEKHGISTELVSDDLFSNVFGELSPVCAITGGVLAQEVVKAISMKGAPIVNLFVYNPLKGAGYVENFVN